MVKRRVPTRIPAGGKFVTVDDEATKGAVVGLDLYWPDGSVVTEAELRNMVANGGGPTLPAGVGSWDELWRIVNSRGGGIPDAPADDEWYERRNNDWERGTTVFVQDDEPMDARRGDTWVQTFPLPSAATGLTATADGSDAIDVAWTDTNGGEAYYKVRRSLDGSTGWVVLSTTAAGGESYRDESVTVGVEYFYDVIAADANGESAASNVDSATPEAEIDLWGDALVVHEMNGGTGTRYVDEIGTTGATIQPGAYGIGNFTPSGFSELGGWIGSSVSASTPENMRTGAITDLSSYSGDWSFILTLRRRELAASGHYRWAYSLLDGSLGYLASPLILQDFPTGHVNAGRMIYLLGLSGGTPAAYLMATDSLTLNTDYEVGVSYDSSSNEVVAYFNGAEYGSTTQALPAFAASGCQIGLGWHANGLSNSNDWGRYGYSAHRFFTRVLTPADFAAHYNSGDGVAWPSP